MNDISLEARIKVGNSVYEDVTLTRSGKYVYVEFCADDLEELSIPIDILNALLLKENCKNE